MSTVQKYLYRSRLYSELCAKREARQLHKLNMIAASFVVLGFVTFISFEIIRTI